MYENLKALRKSLNMTQAEFGHSLGLAKTTYHNYETGIREPSSLFWIAVAKKYGVTIDYLMGYSNDPHRVGEDVTKAPADTDEALQAISASLTQLNDEGRARVVDYAADLVATGRYMIDNDDKINLTMAAYGGGLYKRTITEEQLDALKKAIEETWE